MHACLSSVIKICRGAMGKAGRWITGFLFGRKDKEKGGNRLSPKPVEIQPAPALTLASKDRKRWSFQRSATAGKGMSYQNQLGPLQPRRLSESEIDRKRHAIALIAATSATVDAAVVARKVAEVNKDTATAVRQTTAARINHAIKEAAAIKIQAIFRSYLARKALSALKGLVKLQAIVRGHLVRKHATVTLQCMRSLVMAQARARAQRMRMVEAAQGNLHRQPVHRRPSHDAQFQQSYETDNVENVKIVEMDQGQPVNDSKCKNRYPIRRSETKDQGFYAYYYGDEEQYQIFSPATSGIDAISPRGYGRHFDEFSFKKVKSIPQHQPALLSGNSFPNYMANTKSSRAKSRSQSAPRQRSDSYEKQANRRRTSGEGRNSPQVIKIKRSCSHVDLTANRCQHPCPVKLNHSSMSSKGSECGSTSTVLTRNNCC